jgi:hypothetical protein
VTDPGHLTAPKRSSTIFSRHLCNHIPQNCLLMTSSAMIFERIIIDRNGDSLLNLRLKQSEPVLLAETIPYIVSSNALRATSPYFAAIFQNSFSESKAGFDGKFHFEAFDFPPP